MRQFRHSLINSVLGLGVVLALSSCAADGGLASKTKPLDKEATRLAFCDGAQKVDIAFWSISKSSPGLLPGQALDAEGAFIGTLGFQASSPASASPNTICAKVYTGDLDVAINTALVATVNISRLIQAWNTAK